MDSRPLTNKTKPGGRDRKGNWPMNAFGRWLRKCDMKPDEVATALGKITGDRVSLSAIYNLRNSRYRPGRDLALAIETLTTDRKTGVSACPASMWSDIELRPTGS